MKTTLCAFAVVAALCASDPALARDIGTINQAGVYEETMKFYLHPAHFYWSSEAPQPRSQHPAVLVHQQASPTYNPATPTLPSHPALLGKRQTRLEPVSILRAGAMKPIWPQF